MSVRINLERRHKKLMSAWDTLERQHEENMRWLDSYAVYIYILEEKNRVVYPTRHHASITNGKAQGKGACQKGLRKEGRPDEKGLCKEGRS